MVDAHTKKYQREEKYDVPRIFDQFDQQILRLRHEAKQCETDSKGANRNAYDPKDVREIEDIAPGAWDVTTYHGPKGARVISYLLPGTWDVGRRKASAMSAPDPRSTTAINVLTRRGLQRLRKMMLLETRWRRHASMERCCCRCRHASCEWQEDERGKCQHGDQSPRIVYGIDKSHFLDQRN